MADWFKFYENDLDNELLQWAMSEQQPVGIVYVTILSRCCRDKSDTLPWNGQDFELFALSSRVHITPTVANECLKLLQKIGYIEIGNGLLKVLHWNNRQSEYCQKKAKVSRQCPDSVPTLSGECRLRGEESRIEKSTKTVIPLSVCESIYTFYPRKVKRGDAMKAIAKALKEVSVEKLTEATKAMGEAWRDQPDKRFCPYPASFYNSKQYLDDYETYKPHSQSKPNQRNIGMGINAAEQGRKAAELIAKRNGTHQPELIGSNGL